ncbi:MAG: hypothetical protein ACK47B_11000 [Armatimonadota bacterium]
MSEERLSLAALQAAAIEVPVKIGGVRFRVSYRPAVYTPAFLESLLTEKTLDEALLELISEWSLGDGLGGPLPVTREALESLGVVIQREIMTAIDGAAFPNPKRAGSSASTS